MHAYFNCKCVSSCRSTLLSQDVTQCWVQRHSNIKNTTSLTFHVERSDLGAAAATSRVLGRELLQTRDLVVRRRDVDGEQEAEGVDVIANTLKHSSAMFLHALVISCLTILFCMVRHYYNTFTCTCRYMCTCIVLDLLHSRRCWWIPALAE